MPAKIILVPGTTPRGSWMYSLNFASFQTMPEFLLASEYSKPSTVPEWRPSSPFSTGPILFSASSPMEWQGRHLWNEISPLATSWAHPALAEATIKPAAIISDFIGNSLLIPRRIHASASPTQPNPFKRPLWNVSTAKIDHQPRRFRTRQTRAASPDVSRYNDRTITPGLREVRCRF